MQRRALSPAQSMVIAAVVMTPLLSGCAGLVVGSAATSAVVAQDPRTTGTVVEDQTIELKAHKLLNADTEISEQANVSVTSYNQIVLLSGQAPTEELRTRIAQVVASTDKVRHIHNEIAIGAPSSLASRSKDTLLTTKVKTRLFGDNKLPATHIKVVSEDGVVFLLGLVSAEHANTATEIARTTSGVRKVVKLFEQI